MADFGAIFSVVSRGSALALKLYNVAATTSRGRNDLSRVARSVNNFSCTVKQLGTVIREDDTLISSEAIETLEDIIEQCNALLAEIESILLLNNARKNGDEQESKNGQNRKIPFAESTRLVYLQAHLDSLKSTILVMQQTMYTAQIVIWARVRPSISPQQADVVVATEKTQLESLVIEQQLSILLASKLYHPSRPEARLLMEKDSSRSLVTTEDSAPKSSDLHRYQERFLASLDTSETTEEDWLPAVSGISKSHLERLLGRWTRLRQLHEKVSDEERKVEAQKREMQQPTVESDSEDERHLSGFRSHGGRLATPTPRRPGSVQPLFTETTSLPIPVPDANFGPRAPLSPASSYGASPHTSDNSFVSSAGYPPVSPRSSISSLPVEAAAAVEAKDRDDELDLEIPWKLCTRKSYWEYVDARVKDSDTGLPPSEAFVDRNSWTEILASWVCKAAIKEQRYKYTQVQKERQDGRRTKLETCFCIQHPLTFDQVKRLVERTVEIYRETHRPSPQPTTKHQKRPSFDRTAPHDRDKTPLANQRPHPPLDRSTTYAYPPPHPPQPPPLDRTLSLPGAAPAFQSFPNPNVPLPQPHLHIPPNPGQYAGQPPPQPQPVYSPQAQGYSYSPSTLYPPQLFSPTFQQPGMAADARRLSNSYALPQSPLRQSQTSKSKTQQDHYSSTSTASESDTASRSRKHRSKSRRPSSNSYKKKHSTVGTLATVGGLAALLDGLDLGVL